MFLPKMSTVVTLKTGHKGVKTVKVWNPSQTFHLVHAAHRVAFSVLHTIPLKLSVELEGELAELCCVWVRVGASQRGGGRSNDVSIQA